MIVESGPQRTPEFNALCAAADGLTVRGVPFGKTLRSAWATNDRRLFDHWINAPGAEAWWEAIGKTADANPENPVAYFLKVARNLMTESEPMRRVHGAPPPARAAPAIDPDIEAFKRNRPRSQPAPTRTS